MSIYFHMISGTIIECVSRDEPDDHLPSVQKAIQQSVAEAYPFISIGAGKEAVLVQINQIESISIKKSVKMERMEKVKK